MLSFVIKSLGTRNVGDFERRTATLIKEVLQACHTACRCGGGTAAAGY